MAPPLHWSLLFQAVSFVHTVLHVLPAEEDFWLALLFFIQGTFPMEVYLCLCSLMYADSLAAIYFPLPIGFSVSLTKTTVNPSGPFSLSLFELHSSSMFVVLNSINGPSYDALELLSSLSLAVLSWPDMKGTFWFDSSTISFFMQWNGLFGILLATILVTFLNTTGFTGLSFSVDLLKVVVSVDQWMQTYLHHPEWVEWRWVFSWCLFSKHHAVNI